MKISQKFLLAVNALTVSAILLLNYFYQSSGFDFTLKCICSALFALLGVINLIYALVIKADNVRFYIGMSAGLILAFLGDYLIGYDFIFGAAAFALGHICFVIAYCFLHKIRYVDLLISMIFFVPGTVFLLFSPLLTFDLPIFRIVCIIYALIISLMLGKAVGNFLLERSLNSMLIALASALFLFSDLMLVFDWFIGLWSWTDNACMGTYYPALCILAFSMIIQIIKKSEILKSEQR